MKAWKIVLLVVAFLLAAVSGPVVWVSTAIVSEAVFQSNWEKGEAPGIGYYKGERFEGVEEYKRLEQESRLSAFATGSIAAVAVELAAFVGWVVLLLILVLPRRRDESAIGSTQSPLPVR